MSFGADINTKGSIGDKGDEICNCWSIAYLNELQSNIDETQAALMVLLLTPHKSPGAGTIAASIGITAISVVDDAHLHWAADDDGKYTIREQLKVTDDSGTTEEAKSVGTLKLNSRLIPSLENNTELKLGGSGG